MYGELIDDDSCPPKQTTRGREEDMGREKESGEEEAEEERHWRRGL